MNDAPATQKTKLDPAKVSALAQSAADALIEHVSQYSQMVEHSEWHVLATYIESTLHHLTDAVAREDEAQKMAFFAIGKALGRVR